EPFVQAQGEVKTAATSKQSFIIAVVDLLAGAGHKPRLGKFSAHSVILIALELPVNNNASRRGWPRTVSDLGPVYGQFASEANSWPRMDEEFCLSATMDCP